MFDLDTAKDLIADLRLELDKASNADLIDLHGDIGDYVAGNGSNAASGEATYILIIKGDDVE